jgi:hypothetical protein
MIVRGLLIALLLGFTGFMLVLFSGQFREPGPAEVCNRPVSRQASPTALPPGAVNPDKIARTSSQTEKPQSGVELKNAGETGAGTVRYETNRSHPLPVRIADLAKLHKLKLLIKKYAGRYGVDEDLVWAVVRQESGFNPYAVSPKGAMGLMQLMPGTAARMGVSNAFDVEQNLAGGIKYLERCLSQFKQNVPLALAAYNAGPENVVKYQGCPPFAETRNYIVSILRAYAGGLIRKDWQAVLNPAMGAGVPDPAAAGGLCWRIPLPQWLIAPPRYKLSSPRWKQTPPPLKLSQPVPPPLRDEIAANR